MSPIVRLPWITLAGGAFVVSVVACAPDVGVAPNVSATRAASAVVGSLDQVFTVQLRAYPVDPVFPNDPVYGYGHVQIRLGATLGDSCYPVDPISPAPGFTRVSVCGKIFNEGGAKYRGGGIYNLSPFTEGPGLIAAFNGALPPNPCRRYDIAGAVAVSDAIATDMIAHPDLYQVRMDGDVLGQSARLGGRLDGSAWGPVGARPETDPFFAEKTCTVAVTP
jgi:hypothetical protein